MKGIPQQIEKYFEMQNLEADFEDERIKDSLSNLNHQGPNLLDF